LAAAATRYPPRLWRYFGDYRRDHRGCAAVTDHKTGSGRKRMASEIGEGLEQALVEQAT
jgi:hypothetical protein